MRLHNKTEDFFLITLSMFMKKFFNEVIEYTDKKLSDLLDQIQNYKNWKCSYLLYKHKKMRSKYFKMMQKTSKILDK